MVQGAKIKPKRLTSQGKLKFANDAFTRIGARSQGELVGAPLGGFQAGRMILFWVTPIT
jgi:hypothetical protein